MKGNLSDYMDWLDDSAPSLRQLTGSELSGAIQRYGAVTFTKTVTDQEIRLELDNFMMKCILWCGSTKEHREMFREENLRI